MATIADSARATIGLRIDLPEGGRYVAIPCAAVNGGYDALPPRSVNFNSERDNSWRSS